MKNYCRTCREETSLHEKGICPWCDTPLTEKTGRQNALTDEQLYMLRALYDEGYTVKDIAACNWQAWGYSNALSCQRSISSGWKRLGILVRQRAHRASASLKQNENRPELALRRSQPEKTGA